jgi:hypothetical protein
MNIRRQSSTTARCADVVRNLRHGRRSAPASRIAARRMGPLSINLEEIKYPYAVHYLNLNLYEHDVRIADMDVAPVGRANRQTAGSCMADDRLD